MTTPAPRATPSPTATPTPDFIDTPRGVFHNTPSMTIYPSGPDYAGTTGDDVFSGNFEGENYQSFPAAPTLRLEPSFLFGNPTVETPTASAPFQSAGILDNEPSIFGGGDDWIRNNAEVEASFDSSNSGGSIWSDDNTSLQDFGGETRLGRDLSADLGSLRFGEDYPAGEQVNPESPFDPRAEPTGIPIEPNMLPQDVDNEWTTSLDDRRFLPEPSPSPEPAGPARTVSGVDIRTFGGQSFGNNISLGAYLNTPLSSMRFGEGYGVQSGGRPADLQPGEGYIEPSTQTGGHWVQGPTGDTWVEDSPGSTDAPTGRAVSPEVRRGELVTGTQQANLSSILQQFPSLNNPAAIRAINAGANPRDIIGHNQFDSHAANLFQMSSAAQLQPTNNTGDTGDEGLNKFWSGIWRMEEGGGFSQVGERRPGVRLPSGVLSTVDLNTVRRYNAANSGVRGVPATSAGGRGG